MKLLRQLLPLLAACAVATTAEAQTVRRLGSMVFEPCTLSAAESPVTVAAYCASLSVPEDRTAQSGRQIELAVAFVPGRAKQPRPDPVFMLAGGPGQSALDSFPMAAGAFGPILRDRHVVLVDQRGTGRSHPLDCPQSEDDAPDAAALADPEVARRATERCLANLDADPRHYTTSDAVADLQAVREAIGAPELNLVGISYGTRVALEFLRRHPERTRSVVLDGVVPPELALGAEHARNLEAALDANFARCEADAACRERYGSPRERLTRLLEELRTEPRQVQFRDPLTDARRDETLTADAVAGVVRLYTYVPQLAAMLPRSLAEAASGRPEVLMAQASMIQTLVGEQFKIGMQLAVICSEDADLLRVDPADAGTLMGTHFVETLLAQCAVWPKGKRPADFKDPVQSDRPVLLLSGELDPVTPPRYGEAVLAHLPNGRHVVARGQGHNVMGTGCLPRVMAKFVAGADAAALDTSCLDGLVAPPPFVGSYGWDP